MRRGEYIIRRLILAVVVIISVSIITFVVSRVIPSDPARQWVGPRATKEQIAAATETLGLDLPLHQQYFRYIEFLLKGDLGESIRTHNPILFDLRAFLPATMELVFFAMLLAVVIGIPVGVLAGSKRNSWFDHAARFFSIAGTSMPSFWLGLLLILLFFSKLELLPIGGRFSRDVFLYNPIESVTGFYVIDSILMGNWEALKSVLFHLVLPGFTLALYDIGLTVRMTRSNMIEVLSEKYILAARASGLPNRMIIFKYALRNAIIPTLNLLGLGFVYALTGAIVVEVIFSWPGMGSYVTDAVMAADFPVIMAVTLIVTVLYVFINLVIDLFQTVIDPRVVLE
jgi:peptide/nickel transport system permease protein